MTRAGSLLDKLQFTREIGGVEFVLRRPNPVIGLRVYGEKLFGLVSAASMPEERQAEYEKRTTQEERVKHIKDMLRLCMVSPRLGDVSDPEADAVSFEDLELAGYAAAIFAALIGGDDVDFSESSEGQPEEG